METLSVQCIKYAESTLPESMVFDGGSDKVKIPISFAVFLIESGDRKLLIDAGCDTMPGFDMKDFCSPAVALQQAGVSPEAITDVVITHAHHDHIDALRHFPQAVVHITEPEYRAGKSYIPEDMKVNVFKESYPVTPQIELIEWGGHSKGSAIVKITTVENIYIFAGDECYTDANIKGNRCTGVFFDRGKSAKFVEEFSKSHYRVYTCHDSSLKTERIL